MTNTPIAWMRSGEKVIELFLCPICKKIHEHGRKHPLPEPKK